MLLSICLHGVVVWLIGLYRSLGSNSKLIGHVIHLAMPPQALIFCDVGILMIGSIGFELLEYTLEAQLPNFGERGREGRRK